MIKTSFNQPLIYQIDNTYSLPSFTGTVQWNGNLRKFQVSSGSGWTDIDNNITFHVEKKLSDIIEWAEQKMNFDRKVQELSSRYPDIKDAKEKLDILIALVSTHEAR